MQSRNLPAPVPNSNPKPATLSVYSLLCEDAPPPPKRKRQRRKRDEIERVYKCNFGSCTKAYGTLNHLNAHVATQIHGEKRKPEEFKELRAMYRQQKKLEQEYRARVQIQQQFEKSRTFASDYHNHFSTHLIRAAGPPF